MAGHLWPDHAARKEDSERRRINDILAQFETKPAQNELIEGYYRELRVRSDQGTLSIHSLRLSLSPAADLTSLESASSDGLPTQTTLDEFLRHSPGQRAAIGGLITYLRTSRGVYLRLPKPHQSQSRRNRRKKLEAEIEEFVDLVNDPRKLELQWIELALRYFHGFSKKASRAIVRSTTVQRVDDGYTLSIEGELYFVPSSPSKRVTVPREP